MYLTVFPNNKEIVGFLFLLLLLLFLITIPNWRPWESVCFRGQGIDWCVLLFTLWDVGITVMSLPAPGTSARMRWAPSRRSASSSSSWSCPTSAPRSWRRARRRRRRYEGRSFAVRTSHDSRYVWKCPLNVPSESPVDIQRSGDVSGIDADDHKHGDIFTQHIYDLKRSLTCPLRCWTSSVRDASLFAGRLRGGRRRHRRRFLINIIQYLNTIFTALKSNCASIW